MNNQHSTFSANQDDLEPQLESAVWAVLSEPLPPDAIARVKSQALSLEDTPSPTIRHNTRNNPWSHPWMQFASLAACIGLVIGATMMFPASSNAFSQAIEKLKNAGAFRYNELVYLKTQEQPIVTQVTIAEDGRERKSMQGRIAIHDASGQLRLTLYEESKTATIYPPIEGNLIEPEGQIKWLERLKSYGKKPDKELGSMQIDGRNCLGFEVKPIPSAPYVIWVDAKTNDLVQVEFLGMPKGSPITKSVMKNFEFDISIDPILFSFDAPQGYKSSTAAKLPELLPFEESLVEALKGYTELSNGKFPNSITDHTEWMTVLSKNGVPRTTLAARLGTLTPYFTGMTHDNYDYIGAGMDIHNKRSIVFWYLNPEKQIRAIYNDFTIATIAESDLPKK